MVICTADVCIQQTLPSAGDLYFDKAVNGFLKELFQRWREAGCNHEATLVFFWRAYHDKNAVGELGICAEMHYGLLHWIVTHSTIYTSNKKHFMKNVKECRDVNRQKSIRTRSGCYRHTSHTLWTHSIVQIVRAL